MKEFLKNCKNINYSRKLRTLLDKVKETTIVLNEKRGKSGISLNDLKAIEAWESDIKLSGTPMSHYYDSWYKLNQQQVARKITNNIAVSFLYVSYLYYKNVLISKYLIAWGI